MAELQVATDLPIIASGGVCSVKDIKDLQHLGVAGAIVGRAIYEGRITLPEALAAAAG
jgi:phosphoribosylformimino-5-aminoimidazole carboxamide ribotide isomerase